jgi:hypothetical protein
MGASPPGLAVPVKPGLQRLETDVFELDGHGRPHMKLEGEDAAFRPL